MGSVFFSFYSHFKHHHLREIFSGYVFKVVLLPKHFPPYYVLHRTTTLKLLHSFMYEFIILLVHVVHVNFMRARLSTPLSLLGPSDFESTWHLAGTQHGSVKQINSLGRPICTEPITKPQWGSHRKPFKVKIWVSKLNLRCNFNLSNITLYNTVCQF